jgi:hypothetical protein
MLFHLKSDQDSNTKEVGDFLSFPTDIYFPSSDQWFRRFDFLQDAGVAENCISGQIAAAKEKYDLMLLGWDSSPMLNTKSVDNSPSIPLVT